MIVCHCKRVTDRDIRQAVRQGAMSCSDVSRACNAGGGCRGCHPLIEQIIGQEEPASSTIELPTQIEAHAY